eukprot:scaffold20551_cov60-Cyclotella_meneghiniana.AAC.3
MSLSHFGDGASRFHYFFQILKNKELHDFELYKIQKYLPKFKYEHKISGINARGKAVMLGYGPVKEFGGNLPEKGRNYKEYLDKKGRFNLSLTTSSSLTITKRYVFPTLNSIVQREASRHVTEMLNHIYIVPKWVAEEYMRCCKAKAKAWKTQSTD